MHPKSGPLLIMAIRMLQDLGQFLMLASFVLVGFAAAFFVNFNGAIKRAAADGEGATAGEMAADRVVTQADVHVGVIEDNYTEAGREAKEGRHAAAAAAAASQSVNAVWKNKKRVVSIGASLQGNVTSGSGGMGGGGGGGGGGGLGSVPPPFFKQPTVRPVLGSRHAAHRARTPSGDPGDDPNGEEYT